MKYIDRIMANEKTFHLVLAAFIGVFGGLVNLAFYHLVALIQWIVFQKSGDSAVLAQDLDAFFRILVPTLGGILAGMVLLLRSHFSRIQKPTNVLEVVAVGDGRIGMQSTLVNA
jgi:CIC family chloride channel protein